MKYEYKCGAQPSSMRRRLPKKLLLTAIAFFATLCFNGVLLAQSISLNEKNATIQNVLNKIKNQGKLDVLGNMDLVKKAKPVTIQVNSKSIESVLAQLSRGQDFDLILSNKTILIKEKETEDQIIGQANSAGIQQEQYQISGKVLDQNGEPLRGVSVKLINSRNWASVTSQNGTYALNVYKNSEIIFSMLGYSSQIVKVEGRKIIDIRLTPSENQIEETVVTGYGTKSKNSFTGASTTITREQLEKFNNRNIFSIIQNLDPAFKVAVDNAAGSDPNKIPDITVRGQNMVTGTDKNRAQGERGKYAVNTPLIIMDGFQIDIERLYDFDMNRIESITLLKDASATALYGSRGANGVLVIETRLPKDGKLTVSYSLQPSTVVVDLSDYNLMNAKQKLEYEVLAGLYKDDIPNRQEQLNQIYADKYLAAESGVNTDWMSQPVRSTTSLQHSIRLEGGTGQVRYSIDGNYGDTKGVMKGSDRTRAGAGFNLMYRIADKITFRNMANFTSSKGNNSPYGSFSQYTLINPYYPIYDSNGDLIREYNKAYSDFQGGGRGYIVYNPLYDAHLPHLNTFSGSTISDNLNLEYYILPNLRVSASGSISKSFNSSEFFQSPNNTYYSLQNTPANERGGYSHSSGEGFNVTGNISVNYGLTLGKHVINLLGVSELISRTSESTGYSVVGFLDDQYIDPKMASKYAPSTLPTYSSLVSRLTGTLFNLTYNYDQRFVLESNFRLDGSSAFGKQKRFTSYWSAGAAYNLHAEKFMQNFPVRMLRIFGNYGISGADAFSPTMTNTAYALLATQGLYYNQIGLKYDSEGNANLSWPQIHSLSGGIDGSILDDRIGLRFNVYHKRTIDMVSEITVAPSIGLVRDQYFENIGEVTNKGIEAYINLEAIRNTGSGFSWFLNASAAKNSNKLTKISDALKKLNEDNNAKDYGVVNMVQTPYYEEGRSLDNIKGVVSLGIDPATGNEIFLGRDGKLTDVWKTEDIQVLADAQPKLAGNFGTTLNYKGFSLQAIFNYVIGMPTYNGTLVSKIENVEPRYNADLRVLEERWKQPGDVSFYKGIDNRSATNLTSRFLQTDNIIRLGSLNLNYVFNSDWMSKLKIQRARLNFSMNDLFHISSVRMERGTDYPFARTYNFGFSVDY